MNHVEIKEMVQEKYHLTVQKIEKIKGVYKIYAADDLYCLKVIPYSYGHFLFIISAIKHLQNNGFEKIPSIIATEDGNEYVNIESYYGYLTPWIFARESNYDNPIDVKNATLKLADLHNRSRGFEVLKFMKPRIGWLKWIENFKTRKNEILDFKKCIYAKEGKTEFDGLYSAMMEEELERAENGIQHLIESEYIQSMKGEIRDQGFCHHDYANHNVMIDGATQIYVIDFNYCILDSHLHDLASLLIRRMKNGKWELKNALDILDVYNSAYKVQAIDIPIIAAFMEFPQDYWQVGIQYYWEKQPWEESFFMNKLKRIKEDREEKQDFLEKFRTHKYGKGEGKP